MGWARADGAPVAQVLRGSPRFSGVWLVGSPSMPSLVSATGSLPAGTASVFWIGSISKQMAAAALLRFVEQDRLGLEDPAAKHLPEIDPSALRGDGMDCTIEHLLSHTCGLPRDLAARMDTLDHLRRPDARRALFRALEQGTLSFTPGTSYAYSNVGFDLVGLIVQTLAGRPYAEHLEDTLFRPLGMADTGVDPRPKADIMKRLTPGTVGLLFTYGRADRWLFLDPAFPRRFGASGNIYSTASDLERWLVALHGGRVLTDALYRQMVRPRRNNYGLGLVILGSSEEPTVGHDGALAPFGYSSFAAYRPAQKSYVVVLSNRPLGLASPPRVGIALLNEREGRDIPDPLFPEGFGPHLVAAVPVLVFWVIVVGFGGALLRQVVWPRPFGLRRTGEHHARMAAILFVLTTWRALSTVIALSALVLALGGAGLARGWLSLEAVPRASRSFGRVASMMLAVIVTLAFLYLSPVVVHWAFAGLLVVETCFYIIYIYYGAKGSAARAG